MTLRCTHISVRGRVVVAFSTVARFSCRHVSLAVDEQLRLRNLVFQEHYAIANASPDLEAQRRYCAKMELKWIVEWAASHYAHDEKAFLTAVRKAVLERVDLHKPLSYILQSHPFLGCDILCRPPVLIPRPETEEWTRWLIHRLVPHGNDEPAPISVLDLCCGTGCVGLAIAKRFDSARVVSLDLDATAVQLTLENACRAGVNPDGGTARLRAAQSNMFDALGPADRFDILACNPPYLYPEQVKALPKCIARWESKLALTGDEEHRQPLGYYAAICDLAPRWLNRSVSKDIPNLIVEVGLQAEQVAELFDRSSAWTETELHIDRWKEPRWVTAKLKEA